MKKLFLGLFLISMTLSAFAKTYTKEELNRLAQSGNYPTQGVLEPVSDEVIQFDACKEAAKSIVDSVSSNYPTKVLSDTSLMYSAKVWTNDAAILMTCTQPDNRSTVKKSVYK